MTAITSAAGLQSCVRSINATTPAGLLEDADVPADGLLSEGGARRDLARGQFGVLDQAQDLSAVRLG